ncbi:MAG: hypothetical protein NZ853_03320 [Leptospiraceae bacterium]|nr:hypothetical protein [Leptospiraceae bacterium]MDW7975204.1 hypothetical protein [Leptospiraceae bacterium]
MIVLLLTGLREELEPILKEHPFQFNKNVYAYQSQKYPSLYAATTGPGLQERKKTRKILENVVPEVIINAGLVGVLDERERIQVGDLVKINTIVKAKNQVQFAGGPGRYTLVTVDKPVFDAIEKIDLKYQFHANVCDMEAAYLIELVGSYEIFKKDSYIVFIKVAGDRPENAYLFEHEHYLRKWYRKNWLEKLRIIYEFPLGWHKFFQLLKLKQRALLSLKKHTLSTIEKIFTYGGVPRNVGSIFIPHEEVNIL